MRVVLIGAAAAFLGRFSAPSIRSSDLATGAGVLVGVGLIWAFASKRPTRGLPR